MPLVFDNIIFNLQSVGGISRYWLELIKPYKNSEFVTFIEHRKKNTNLYRNKISLGHLQGDHRLPVPIARYINFSQAFFDEKYIFHSSYFRVNTAPNVLNVTTVHDLMYEKFLKGIRASIHIKQKYNTLLKSDCIVCVSEHTLHDLYEFYPFCKNKKVVIIPNGVEKFNQEPSHLSSMEHFSLTLNTKKFFLYVGNRGVYKGFSLVHDVLDLLGGDMVCVAVGNPFDNRELNKIEQLNHGKLIVNVGRVNDSDLNQLYNLCEFFFFPSLYEGFGIPLLESMSAGAPILASNRASIPEVAGNAAILFDPENPHSLREALFLINQTENRAQLILNGFNRASDFNWGSVEKKYLNLYAELMSL